MFHQDWHLNLSAYVQLKIRRRAHLIAHLAEDLQQKQRHQKDKRQQN